MDVLAVGKQIADLRKAKRLTQADLGERLGVTFQAVSKWERGEALPDTAILPDLAAVLETTADNLLSGGARAVAYTRRLTMEQVRTALGDLDEIGRLLGRDNLLYRAAIEGINTRMNADIEQAFTDGHILEVFMAEAAIQSLRAGAYIDPTDVRDSLGEGRHRDAVLDVCAQRGIK